MAKVEGRDNFGEDPKFLVGIEVERKPFMERKHCLLLTNKSQRDFTEMFR